MTIFSPTGAGWVGEHNYSRRDGIDRMPGQLQVIPNVVNSDVDSDGLQRQSSRKTIFRDVRLLGFWSNSLGPSNDSHNGADVARFRNTRLRLSSDRSAELPRKTGDCTHPSGNATNTTTAPFNPQ